MFTVNFLSLFQTHVYKNVSDELRIAILVLLVFRVWYVGLWRISFFVEFGGVEGLLYLIFYLLFVVDWFLFFIILIIVEFILLLILLNGLMLLLLSFLFLFLYLCLVDVNIINTFTILLLFFVILEFLKFFIIHTCNVDIIRINLLQNFISSVTKM